MVIAGAGGHAMEVLDILISKNQAGEIVFFDEFRNQRYFEGKYPILKTEKELKHHFLQDPRFILGTGNPKTRKKFYERFSDLGGNTIVLRGNGNLCSDTASIETADIMNLCFVGPKVQIGRGTLINCGALVHHEVSVGEFCEIAPRAVLLGKVKLGDFVMVGSNATILPNVKIGNHVFIGAGAVIHKDVPDNVTIAGVPGKIIKFSE
ncbi:acetyltransferase [Cyclobacterium jeungdonense]|uniref:Acetyltransferase n=1 Tax=Cyclobacterium jeungdonense TaxID=708087 RepID=A0ABT8CFP1_9BACT|nr:acetyltransferase [Cyclobacterium jeungdonense]MDN3690588.1 acetyltransferase [Cyclobacterium jeungdonense]